MSNVPSTQIRSNRLKFIIAGALFIIVVVFLIVSATQSSAQFFLTIKELQESEQDYTGENVRISGAVIGESMTYDPDLGRLFFTIAHIPGEDSQIQAMGGLSFVLHQAVVDPENPRLDVVYEGVAPDMLRDEAQAILTGQLQADGTFFAEELLLKCPSKYEEALPEQVED